MHIIGRVGPSDKVLFAANQPDNRDQLYLNGFTPTFFDDIALLIPQSVSETCQNNRFCILDSFVSGYPQMGNYTSIFLKKSIDENIESSKE